MDSQLADTVDHLTRRVCRGVGILATALAATCVAPSIAVAVPETPVLPTDDEAKAAPSDTSPRPEPASPAPKEPQGTGQADDSAAAAKANAGANALIALNTGEDSYNAPIGGNAARATAPEPGVIGAQRAFVKYTSVDTVVMLGAGNAEGQGAVSSGSGVAAELQLFAVSRERALVSFGGTYLKLLDADRHFAIASVGGGYRLWSKVHGRTLGFVPDELMVRTTRSTLFLVGSASMVGFGNYTYRDEDGNFRYAPDDSIQLGFGFTFERRREKSLVIVSAEPLREMIRGQWGARGRVLIRVRRYSGALTVRKIDGLLQQTQLTAGIAF